MGLRDEDVDDEGEHADDTNDEGDGDGEEVDQADESHAWGHHLDWRFCEGALERRSGSGELRDSFAMLAPWGFAAFWFRGLPYGRSRETSKHRFAQHGLSAAAKKSVALATEAMTDRTKRCCSESSSPANTGSMVKATGENPTCAPRRPASEQAVAESGALVNGRNPGPGTPNSITVKSATEAHQAAHGLDLHARTPEFRYLALPDGGGYAFVDSHIHVLLAAPDQPRIAMRQWQAAGGTSIRADGVSGRIVARRGRCQTTRLVLQNEGFVRKINLHG